ncbi:MAG: hypothetical protein C4299_00035 [Thermoleophilia bacterium]
MLHHVGIAVEDLEKAKERYGLLGYALEAEGVVEGQGVRVAMLKKGESRLELLAPLGPETPVGRFLAKRGGGLHHLAFATQTIEEDLACGETFDGNFHACVRPFLGQGGI